MSLNLQAVRALYPHSQKQIYFNHASISPVSNLALEQMLLYLQERHQDCVENFPLMLPRMEELRARIARYINAEGPETIAFISNTTTGLNILAAGLNWQKGDRIVLNNMEFPANVYPFLNLQKRGVEIDMVQAQHWYISLESLAEAFSQDTRLLSVSSVQFLTGQYMPLKALGQLCREHDALFCVDGIQSLGAQPLDVQALGIDFLSTGGHKWLMGLEGLGFIYVAPALLEQLQLAHVGWLSVEDAWELLDYDLRLRPDAARFELGTPNFIGMMALNAALKTFEHFGLQEVEAQVRRVANALLIGLHDRGLKLLNPLNLSESLGIVCCEHPEAEILQAELLKHQIMASVREKRFLRFSPHYYNSLEEVEQVFAVLDRALN